MSAESTRTPESTATAANDSVRQADIDTGEMTILDDATPYDLADVTLVQSAGEPTRADMMPVRRLRPDSPERHSSPRERVDRALRKMIGALVVGIVGSAAAYGLLAGNDSDQQETPSRPALTTTSTINQPTTTVPETRRRTPPLVETTVTPTTEQPATTTTAAPRRVMPATTVPDIAQQIINRVQEQINARLSPATTAADTIPSTTTTVPQTVGVPTTRLS